MRVQLLYLSSNLERLINMQKWRIRLVIFLVTLGLLVPAGALVLAKEKDRKYTKAQSDIEYFKNLEADYAKYRQEQLDYIKKTVEENKKNMEDAKATYAALLQQQPALIDAHKRQVAVVSNVPAQQQVVTTKKSSSSSSSSSAPSKPKSSGSTKSS